MRFTDVRQTHGAQRVALRQPRRSPIALGLLLILGVPVAAMAADPPCLDGDGVPVPGAVDTNQGSEHGTDNTTCHPQASAYGFGNNASASASSAFGLFNQALAHWSVAVGTNNLASEDSASAVGVGNFAGGNSSNAFGRSNRAE